MSHWGENKMILQFSKVENKLIVQLYGELDHHSAEEVRCKLDDFIENEKLNLMIMDFSAVSFMDSSGIGVVIGRYKKLTQKKGKLAVINAQGNIKRVFELSGILKIINAYDNLDQALSNI